MSRAPAPSGSSSDLEDPDYQPYLRRQSSARPSRRPSTGGGDNQTDQPPHLPLSPKRKRPKAELTHNDTGKTDYENAARKEIGSSFVDPSLALIHRSIINKYGDIGRESPVLGPNLRSYILERICEIVKELEGKTLEDLDDISLSDYDSLLRDADFLKFDVKWLRQRLDELRDAFKSFVESKQATNEKINILGGSDDTKRNLQIPKENIERIQLKVEEQESELVVKTNDDAERVYKIRGVNAEAFVSPPKSIKKEK